MGLAFTGYHFKIDEKAINFEDMANEPWMNNDLRRGIFVPDATCGVYLLNSRYSVGFSADQLFEASLKVGDLPIRIISLTAIITFSDHITLSSTIM